MTDFRFDPPGPGSWNLDAVHHPRPVTQYWAEMHPEPFRRGTHEFMAYYGSLLGSLLLSNVSSVMRLTRLMMVSSSLWYAMLLVFAQARSPLWAIPFLIMAGVMQSFSMVSLQITLLREAGQRFRGRVMGVRMMAIYSLPIGLLAAGPLIDAIGYRAMASSYAIVGIVFTTLNTAVVAPTPRASTNTVVMVKLGARSSRRAAKRISATFRAR